MSRALVVAMTTGEQTTSHAVTWDGEHVFVTDTRNPADTRRLLPEEALEAIWGLVCPNSGVAVDDSSTEAVAILAWADDDVATVISAAAFREGECFDVTAAKRLTPWSAEEFRTTLLASLAELLAYEPALEAARASA